VALAEAGGRYLVLRTSWVYSAHGKNFLRTMLRLGAERSELSVVDDQIGAPTSAAAIAAATVRLLEQSASVPSGIYHMTAAGSTSWCGFARAIFDAGVLAHPPRVQPIPSSSYPTPARRPSNSVLANDKFAHTFAFRLPSWQQQLDEILAGMQVAS
jgi:dTDP-4-dehydrorhamnose reductase